MNGDNFWDFIFQFCHSGKIVVLKKRREEKIGLFEICLFFSFSTEIISIALFQNSNPLKCCIITFWNLMN